MYYLMNKNIKLASFDLVNTFGVEEPVLIEELTGLPVWIPNIKEWIETRSAVKHRKHIENLFKEYGISDIRGFIDITRCLSLTDTLWVKSDFDYVDWEDVSLYTHEFNEVLSKSLFEGIILEDLDLSLTSPDVTTDGQFDKCWIREDNTIKLIKCGTGENSVYAWNNNHGREPYSEVLASPIFEILCGGVHYDLDKYSGRTVSKCMLFTDEKYGYISYARYYRRRDGILELFPEYEKLGSLNEFIGMIIADCVTINSDRHYGNFGFKIDNDTLLPVGINKCFDYNLALFPRANWNFGFEDMFHFQMHNIHRFGYPYDSLAKPFINDRYRAELINLKDLILHIECDEVFDRKRLDFVNWFKNKQIDMLLGNRVNFNLYSKENKATSISKLLAEAGGNK